MTGEFLISLKQADRSFYPLFRGGAAQSMNLSLSAARPEQEKLSLEFYYEAEDQEGHSLGTLEVQRPEQGHWDNLELKLTMEEGQLAMEVLLEGQVLESSRLDLPAVADSASEDDSAEKGKSKKAISTVLAVVVFILNLGAAYFMGDYLSSPAPPALGSTGQQQVDETTVR